MAMTNKCTYNEYSNITTNLSFPLHTVSLSFPPFILTDNLKGMYESSGKLPDSTADAVKSAVREVANVSQVVTSDAQMLRFAGITFASNLPVLVTFLLDSKITVNSEKMVINSVLLKTIKEAIGHS